MTPKKMSKRQLPDPGGGKNVLKRSQALEEQKAELDAIMRETRSAFEGEYAEQLEALAGISEEDLKKITPSLTSKAEYLALMDVVKNASAKNLGQAQLKARVEALGETAIAIAKSVASLARLLA